MKTAVKVRVDPKNFQHGLRQAKRLGGTYDPATKTWTLRIFTSDIASLAALNLVVVSGTVPAPISTRTHSGHSGHCRGCGGAIRDAAQHRAMGGFCGSCAFDEFDM